jgi:hypothetical protein
VELTTVSVYQKANELLQIELRFSKLGVILENELKKGTHVLAET